MSARWRGVPKTWWAAGLILVLTAPLFLLGLGERNIWIPLEARYGLVAREMLQGGHWILPHLGGQVYPDKPPLLFWTIALISAATHGVSEWTARLPAALAAVGVCLVTWRLGVRLFSSYTGVLAALIVATSAGFFWSGRQALPDMLLTFWTTAAAWALWEWIVAGRPSAAMWAGLCMGLATLTKGPVGLLLPALAALAFVAIRWDWPRLRWRELTLCAGTCLGVSLAWYLPAVRQGGWAYVQATLVHHSLERYVHAWEHQAPWYFYVWAFPAEFLPWTLFLPHAVIEGLQQRRQEGADGWWFAWCWLVVILVFFSISTGKRDIYILPAYPAAALLVGWVWARQWPSHGTGTSAWGVRLTALGLALGLWLLAGGIFAAVHGLVPSKSTLLLPTAPEMRTWMGVLLIVGGIVVAGTALTQHPRAIYAAIVGCTWGAMVMVVTWIYTPQFNQRYPIKAFAAAISSYSQTGQALALCGPMNDLAVRFNIGSFVPQLLEETALVRYLTQDREVYCVMDQRTYQHLSRLTGRSFPTRVWQDIGDSALLLISNRSE